MGKTISIITAGIRGVDSHSDPLAIGGRSFRHSVNLQFQSGRVMTRPVFDYMKLGLKGQFQGATLFRPSLGISFRPFAPCGSRMATAVSGRVYVNNAPSTGVECNPMQLTNPGLTEVCGEVDELCSGDIHLYQAENLLVVQSLRRNTMWWTGEGPLTVSAGMVMEGDQLPDHSHDTMQTVLHRNYLINGAGLGVYWNGRVHQQGPDGIYVGDQIHKRGSQSTDDIVLMEEQSLAVGGGTLSTNSQMGSLMALAGIPQMDTPNGEGRLLGYYEGGIVSYNTFQFPRLSAFDAEGKRLASGWDTMRMVSHNCNVVTATGRYAVGVVPRDHFFRSGFGIHVLSRVLGVEFINDEPVNVLSDEVNNVLAADDEDLLHGAAAGCWFRGHRWFMTTGFEVSAAHSSSPAARGFVSWNKTWTKTVDKTPLPAWEGVWVVDSGMFGIHKFTGTGMREDRGCYGFLASDTDRSLWFAAIQKHGAFDLRDGKVIAVPWAFETGRYDFGDKASTKTITAGRFEGLFYHKGIQVTVYVRTDVHPVWSKWRVFDTCEKELKPGDRYFVSKPLGRPGANMEEATWFEFRVEGTGAAEITGFEVEISEGTTKMEDIQCRVVTDCTDVHPLKTTL